jgi:F0F1-type ATP synthase assembly protein I
LTSNEPHSSDKSGPSDPSKKALLFVADGVLGAAALVVLGVFAGNWLDAKLHTAPWWSVGLSMLGGGLGLWRLCVKALALDDGGKGKTLTAGAGKSPVKKSSAQGQASSAEGDSGASAPKAAYERFMDEERD